MKTWISDAFWGLVLLVLGLAFILFLSGCATFESYAGPPIVTIEHNHRGLCIGGNPCIRQLWINNGTDCEVAADVTCPDSNWHVTVAPHTSRGFGEFGGECSARIVDGDSLVCEHPR